MNLLTAHDVADPVGYLADAKRALAFSDLLSDAFDPIVLSALEDEVDS